MVRRVDGVFERPIFALAEPESSGGMVLMAASSDQGNSTSITRSFRMVIAGHRSRPAHESGTGGVGPGDSFRRVVGGGVFIVIIVGSSLVLGQPAWCGRCERGRCREFLG